MTDPERDPSIEAEPHFRKNSYSADDSEDAAARRLAEEQMSGDPDEERAKHSIFDEPATLPHRDPIVIGRDWTCRNCGYNLRGLPTGHPCPECGVIEHYEPPRDGELTYARWVAQRGSQPSATRAWVLAAAVPLLGGPWALICSLFLTEYTGLLNFVAFGPIIAEVAKVAIPIVLVERMTGRFTRPGQIHLMVLGTALVFAVVQNLLYLAVVYKNSPVELIAWRWVVCVILHCLCSAFPSHALATVWQSAREQQRSTSIAPALRAVTLAVLIHAAYNTCVFMDGWFGYGL